MDFHPILEKLDVPSEGLWYVVSSPNSPSPRVGASCTCVYTTNKASDIYIVGGANPNALFEEIYKFDMKKFVWKKLKPDGMITRYEHCAVNFKENSKKIFIFGGTNQDNNLNSTQVFNTETLKCEAVECEGQTPLPRTCHGAAKDGDKIYLWGGGHQQSEPVQDLLLHILDAQTHRWSNHTLKNDIPTPRQGHILEFINNKLYLHGGMSGSTLYGDLFCIDLSNNSCKKLQPTGDVPTKRAAHSSCSYKQHLYVFGGLTSQGVSSDLYKYNTTLNKWTLMHFDCPPPASRLSHSLFVANIACCNDVSPHQTISANQNIEDLNIQQTSQNSRDTNGANIINVDLFQASNQLSDQLQTVQLESESEGLNYEKEEEKNHFVCPVVMVFGGMDTSGNFYNDLMLTKISE